MPLWMARQLLPDAIRFSKKCRNFFYVKALNFHYVKTMIPSNNWLRCHHIYEHILSCHHSFLVSSRMIQGVELWDIYVFLHNMQTLHIRFFKFPCSLFPFFDSFYAPSHLDIGWVPWEISAPSNRFANYIPVLKLYICHHIALIPTSFGLQTWIPEDQISISVLIAASNIVMGRHEMDSRNLWTWTYYYYVLLLLLFIFFLFMVGLKMRIISSYSSRNFLGFKKIFEPKN